MFTRLLSKRLGVRYIQVGAMSAFANFVFFAIARSCVDPKISDVKVLAFSTVIAIVFAFYLQATYVWETGYKDLKAAIRFTILNLFALFLNIVILKILTSQALSSISAQAISLIAIAGISYIVQKKWIVLV